MGTQLLCLPDELLILIMAFLRPRSLIACQRSCSRLCAIIERSGLLRYKILIMKGYIEDLSPPAPSISDFLQDLRGWEKAWLSLHITQQGKMFRRWHGFNRFLLLSGYLIQKHKRPGWSYLDLSLQPGLRGTPSIPRWSDVHLEANVHRWEWALDVDQDLVAVSLLS